MRNVLDRITKVTDAICMIVGYCSMAVVIILMLMVVLDIILGNVLRSPIPGMYEVCQVLLTTVVFSSWAYTQTQHGHIHVVLFISKFPQKLRFFCFGFTGLLSCAVTGVATYALVKQVALLMKTGECTGTLQIPYWPFYIFELVAFAMLTVVMLLDAIKAFYAMTDDEMAAKIEALW
jgi:TRAP-type C4-dicarboxylate transport system permease small subunit